MTSADPDEMLHNAAFQLDLRCLQTYTFGVSGLQSLINSYSYIIQLLAMCEGNIRLSYIALTEGQQFFFYYTEFLF